MSSNNHDSSGAASIRNLLLTEHGETIAAVIEAGRAVNDAIGGKPVTEPDAITTGIEAAIAERSLAAPLLELLEASAQQIGESIQGQPVPAPPYLVVTSCGPICRGTLSSGLRLVIEFELWTVERDPVRYRFRDPTPADCLHVAVR